MNQRASMQLVVGNDELRVNTVAREFIAGILPPSEEAFGLEVVNGSAESGAAAQEALRRSRDALQTLAFLGGGKVVWLQDAGFLGDTACLKEEAVHDQMDALLEVLRRAQMGTNTLLITAPKIDKRSALCRWFSEQGALRECMLPEKTYQQEDAARRLVGDSLHAKGIRAGENVVRRLVELVGVDPRSVTMEVEKLGTFLGERREVTTRDLEAIACSNREALVWDLTDAVGRRDLGAALRLLRQLLFQREQPVRLVAAIADRLRDLRLYRLADTEGWLRPARSGRGSMMEWGPVPPDVEQSFAELWSKDPRSVHPYRAGQLVAQARRYSPQELQRGLGLALELHERLVSGSASSSILLELLLVRVMDAASAR